ncbi:hypothetical protein HNR60_003668 [Rhodopseudomonas rhenobacensis]|uniref:Cysteine rich repeat-containing protein n=1 Tax=Rhodopseudomonas rhenobacensis TaxID=87461 RepID=A0A7W7Z7H4_9BRAD|nr:hypothetical protein [Rhodopseudomonas rhenobacensis]MBB5048897.1 hypothetical protein [Rhodopseudomonas rhenobacensis]
MAASRMLLVAAASLGLAAPAFAQEGTEAQRDACMPDAFRLCSSAIPDSARVESCLRSAGPRLSSACYAVFNPPGASTNNVRTARRQIGRPANEMVRPVDDEE